MLATLALLTPSALALSTLGLSTPGLSTPTQAAPAPSTQDTPETLVRALLELRRTEPSGLDAAVARVLALQPDFDGVMELLEAGVLPYPERVTAGWSFGEATDRAGVTRPFQLYLPPALLEATQALPLLVHLHGAVSRDAFATELGGVGSAGREWVESAESQGFPVVYPLGRKDCAWWTVEGQAHVDAVVRELKRRLPIDDHRIFLTGFSDGGSGAYYRAMTQPHPFAGILPLNGHPAVASGASGQDLFPRNLATTPMVVAMTRDDSLYPTRDVLPHLQPALESGGRILVLAYDQGGHTAAYFGEQRGTFERFLRETRRNPWPSSVLWNLAPGAPLDLGWIRIMGMGPTGAEAEVPPPAQVIARNRPTPGEPVYRRRAPVSQVSAGYDELQIRLQTREVSALRLGFPRELLGRPAPRSVVWNGRTIEAQWELRTLEDVLRDYAREADPRALVTYRVDLSF